MMSKEVTKKETYDNLVKQRVKLILENTKLRERVKYLEDLIDEYATKITAISKIKYP